MYINTFKYTPKDVSCQLCTEYVKKLGCTALRCPWLAERIEAGVVGYFDGLGFKKLPTIKALNTEYAELLAEKKAAYADYRKAREEMKELLTAKANIDRILELDKEQEEANEQREKEAEQR